MTIWNVVLIGLIGMVIGVLIAMKLYNNYHKELESSILYWRKEYEQSNHDANKIADAYEELKEQFETAVKLPEEYQIKNGWKK